MTSTPQQDPPAGATEDPTARERLSWMSHNSSRLIIGLIVLLIAALVVAFSFSLFGSASANPGNLATSGNMSINNSAEGAAILTAVDLLPSESSDGTVAITNVGDAAGDFTLTASNLVDTPASPAFSGVLNLVITDGTTEVYNGPLADISTVGLGTWAAGEARTYTFTVTFAEADGNEYQNAETKLDFTWNATQSTA